MIVVVQQDDSITTDGPRRVLPPELGDTDSAILERKAASHAANGWVVVWSLDLRSVTATKTRGAQTRVCVREFRTE